MEAGALLLLVGGWVTVAGRRRSEGRIYHFLSLRPASSNPWVRDPHRFMFFSGLAMATLGALLMLRVV
jgi:hypothetical protein